MTDERRKKFIRLDEREQAVDGGKFMNFPEWEAKRDENLFNEFQVPQLWLRGTVDCIRHTNGNNRPRCAVSCLHTTQLDEVHPDKIVLLPERYFLCGKCFQLLERAKFNIIKHGVIKCRECVSEAIKKVQAKDPALFVDLRTDTDSYFAYKFFKKVGIAPDGSAEQMIDPKQFQQY